jgi:hypothetical protein
MIAWKDGTSTNAFKKEKSAMSAVPNLKRQVSAKMLSAKFKECSAGADTLR